MINPGIYREYDIRGVVGQDLTTEVALMLGKGFAELLTRLKPDAKKVSVGRDVRLSSESLANALIQGILSTGLDVVDLGVCPTPLQYFSLFHLHLDGGIMVTGSHNPPEFNGFKISIGSKTIFGKDIQNLRTIIDDEAWKEPPKSGKRETFNIIQAYKDYMLREFSQLADKRYPRIKIAVDAGNGTAGLLVPELLEKMGCEVVPLFCDPDGNFPNHHPDPTVPKYLKDLIRETTTRRAHFGVGYDGDADRIGLVNGRGEIVWGDQLLIVLSRDLLKKRPGATIIADVKCSQVLFDDIKLNGGRPIMWKTGHSLIKEKMKQENALLAGEFSGHIFIGDRYFGYDDAIYTTFRLVEIMKTTGADLTALLSDIPKLHHTPEIRLDCPDDRKQAVVKAVIEKIKKMRSNPNTALKIKKIQTRDGIRAVFRNGWALIRASNTHPVVILRVEADTEEKLQIYRKFMEDEFKQAEEEV